MSSWKRALLEPPKVEKPEEKKFSFGSGPFSNGRRWWKTPPEILAEFERLLLETDFSIDECERRAGIKHGSNADEVVKKTRRLIGGGRWVNRVTGKVHPADCTLQCAAIKTGLSTRTIKRRVREGLVRAAQLPSNKGMQSFTDAAITKLKEQGRKPIGPKDTVIKPEDVFTIRRLRENGIPSRKIAEMFHVSQRHINRVLSGERWARFSKAS